MARCKEILFWGAVLLAVIAGSVVGSFLGRLFGWQ